LLLSPRVVSPASVKQESTLVEFFKVCAALNKESPADVVYFDPVRVIVTSENDVDF